MIFFPFPLFNSCKNLLINHVGVLTYFFDPVLSPQTAPYQQLEPGQQNGHFLFPVFYLVGIYILYSDLPLFFRQVFSSSSSSSSNGSASRPNASQLAYSPAAVFPLEIWPQSEVASMIGFSTSAAVLVTLVVVGRTAHFKAAGRYELLATGKSDKAVQQPKKQQSKQQPQQVLSLTINGNSKLRAVQN